MVTTVIPIELKREGNEIRLSRERLRVGRAKDQRVRLFTQDGQLEFRFLEGDSPFESQTACATAHGSAIDFGPVREAFRPGSDRRFEVILKKGAAVLGRVEGVFVFSDDSVGETRAAKILVEGDTVRVEPEPVVVNRTMEDQVDWTCAAGRFRVEFDGPLGSPFPRAAFEGASRGHARSGGCRRSAEKGLYKYTVTVWRDSGGPPLVLDPNASVEDDGGDIG